MLGQDSVAVLKELKGCIREWLAESNGLWQNTDHVFPSTAGTPIDPSNLIWQFWQLFILAGLLPIRFQGLRDTAAALMLNNRIDVLVFSKCQGHAKPSITLEVYGHLLPSIHEEAAERLNKHKMV